MRSGIWGRGWGWCGIGSGIITHTITLLQNTERFVIQQGEDFRKNIYPETQKTLETHPMYMYVFRNTILYHRTLGSHVLSRNVQRSLF